MLKFSILAVILAIPWWSYTLADGLPEAIRTPQKNPTQITHQTDKAASAKNDPCRAIAKGKRDCAPAKENRTTGPTEYEKAYLDIQVQLAKATDKIAALTVGLVVVGGLQILTAVILACIALQQHTTFRAIERAWVLMKPPTVKIGWLDDPKLPSGKRAWVWITLNIKNAGKTPATIINCRCGFQFHHKLPPRPDYFTEGFDDQRRWVPLSGDMVFDDYISRSSRSYYAQESKDDHPLRTAPLHFLGYIEYLDIFKKLHTTKFCFIIQTVEPDPKALFLGDDQYNNHT